MCKTTAARARFDQMRERLAQHPDLSGAQWVGRKFFNGPGHEAVIQRAIDDPGGDGADALAVHGEMILCLVAALKARAR